jgi:GNAT superfamily N-acetyltransferase
VRAIRDEYEISDDKSRLDVDAIAQLLATSYWAADRPREVIARSIEHSLCLGLYCHDAQIGFGRIITDQATFAWIADLIVDPAYRGRGLGIWLVETIVAYPAIKNLRQLLATRDAHTLYEKLGYERFGDIFLGRGFVRFRCV